MVVSSDKTTDFILASDPDRLAQMEDAIRQGNVAIGFIGIVKNGRKLYLHKELFEEYVDQGWGETVLGIVRLLTALHLSAARTHVVKERDGWPE